MNISISVIIPTFRRPSLLTKCIQSLLRQQFLGGKYEIIVVSDGPDQGTEAAVSSIGDTTTVPLRYIPLQQKGGPAAARNAGWRNAQGKLIAFTDDDCLADSAWLASLWKEFTTAGDAVAITGKVVVPVSASPTDYELNIRNLERAGFVTANCACSQFALQITGGFDEAFSMAWREDSDLYFKLLSHGIPVLHAEEAVVIHPVRAAAWGVSLREQRKSMFNALLYKKYPGLYRAKIQRRPIWLYYFIVVAFLAWIITVLMNGVSGWSNVFLVLWVGLTGYFAYRRLARTSHTPGHVLEMIVTSFAIPFLSLYWRFYGSWKYKTLVF